MPAPAAVAAGEGEDERDEPCGAEAAPARQQDQPQRVSPPDKGRTVPDRAAIKRGFKKAATATTAIAGPKPSQRRRRGDAGGLFKMTWRALVWRARPTQSYTGASIFLSEMLDWMTVFVPDTAATMSEHDSNLVVQHDWLSLQP